MRHIRGKPFRMIPPVRTRGLRIMAALSSLILVLLLVGCQGAPGTDGVSMGETDHIPPVLRLVSPPPDSVLFDDQVTFAAEAVDSGGAVGTVTMYFNPPGTAGFDSVLFTQPPYQFTYDFSPLEVRRGLLWFYLAASDTAGNMALTPMIPFRLDRYTGQRVLQYYFPYWSFNPGDSFYLQIPDAGYDIDSGALLWYVRYFAIRFQVPTECQLVGVDFLFLDPAHLPGGTIQDACDFNVILWDASAGGAPGQPLDSLLVDAGSVVFDDWSYADLQSLQGDTSAYTITGDRSYFLGISPTVSFSDTMDTGLYLVSAEDSRENLDPDPRTDHSWELEAGPAGRGWGTLREHFGGQNATVKYDWIMRIYVDYGDGETVVLEQGAGGMIQPPERTAVFRSLARKIEAVK